jgi:hypothetical protein
MIQIFPSEFMDKTPNKSQSSLLGIFINILLPVLILDYCSAGPANPLERPEGENFWHIGPVWALVIALSLPLVYGIRSLVVSRKFDLMSVVGMAVSSASSSSARKGASTAPHPGCSPEKKP